LVFTAKVSNTVKQTANINRRNVPPKNCQRVSSNTIGFRKEDRHMDLRPPRASIDDAPAEIHLESPVSIKHVLNFAALFLLIQIVSTLGERYLRKPGFLGISVLGVLSAVRVRPRLPQTWSVTDKCGRSWPGQPSCWPLWQVRSSICQSFTETQKTRHSRDALRFSRSH